MLLTQRTSVFFLWQGIWLLRSSDSKCLVASRFQTRLRSSQECPVGGSESALRLIAI